MKKFKLTHHIGIVAGLALAGSASAATIDFSGTNFYMKMLDGNMRQASTSSIDTNSGNDQGQFTEMNLIFKTTLSPQVEAGGRIQSRSSASYWTDYGGFGNEGNVNGNVNDMKFMKLRGAYVELTPGYSWLSNVHIGTSDWGMFDPFTVGKVRYIDRDNYNGLYFKGPISTGSTWEFARISPPNYLQFNYGQGPTCCSTDATQYNEVVYIAQVKVPVSAARVTASFQNFTDHNLASSGTPTYTGTGEKAFYENDVASLKAEGSATDSLNLRGAYYWSKSKPSAGAVGEVWGNTPTGSINDHAIKLDADWTTPVEGLSFNVEAFNIGAGYFSMMAARRESDVLLTEGNESAWYKWGNPLWDGGAAADYTQGAASPNGGPNVPNGTQNGLTDNAFMDFDESPTESVIGWKGMTVVGKADMADLPMSLELTGLGYNNSWQNYPATGPLYNVFPAYGDRTTGIAVYKISHIVDVLGGLDVRLKLKGVWDKDKMNDLITTDDRNVYDKGTTLSVGNQLNDQLYGTLSVGRYLRDISVGGVPFNNNKNIYSLKFAYNLPGFEAGMLTQWIRGHGNPTETPGGDTNIKQYRLKTYMQVNF